MKLLILLTSLMLSSIASAKWDNYQQAVIFNGASLQVFDTYSAEIVKSEIVNYGNYNLIVKNNTNQAYLVLPNNDMVTITPEVNVVGTVPPSGMVKTICRTESGNVDISVQRQLPPKGMCEIYGGFDKVFNGDMLLKVNFMFAPVKFENSYGSKIPDMDQAKSIQINTVFKSQLEASRDQFFQANIDREFTGKTSYCTISFQGPPHTNMVSTYISGVKHNFSNSIDTFSSIQIKKNQYVLTAHSVDSGSSNNRIYDDNKYEIVFDKNLNIISFKNSSAFESSECFF